MIVIEICGKMQWAGEKMVMCFLTDKLERIQEESIKA